MILIVNAVAYCLAVDCYALLSHYYSVSLATVLSAEIQQGELCIIVLDNLLEELTLREVGQGITQEKANICSIFKKVRQDEARRYRAVSLTSFCSITMEHILFHKIISYLNSNYILIENQHGCRTGHSCLLI